MNSDKKTIEKLLNLMLVKKFPNIIEKIKVGEIRHYPNDTGVSIDIYITKMALKKCYKNYRLTNDDDELINDIDKYSNSMEDVEMDLCDVLDINIYDELESILGFVIHKNPIPNYSIITPKTINESRERKKYSPEDLLSKKKILIKYWDKFGPKLDDVVFKMVGEEKYVEPFWGFSRQYLREYLGEEVSKHMFIKIVKTAEKEGIEEGDCGTYNFKWKINSLFFDKNNDVQIMISADENGYLTDIHTGVKYTLKEISKKEDDFWQVLQEMEECVIEKIYSMNAVENTGIEVSNLGIAHIKYMKDS